MSTSHQAAPLGTPLNIAILGSRGYPSTYGGFETFVRRIAPAWVARGHRVTVYCRARPASGRRVWHTDGVRCVWTPGLDSKSASTLTFGLTSHLDAAFRKVDAALVLNVANGYFLPMLRAQSIPTALNTDGLEWLRGKWGKTARQVFYQGAKLSARYADVLISDSQRISEIWRSELHADSRFIPYGADVIEGMASDRVEQMGIEPKTYALVVARLIPENNVELTLAALEQIGHVPAVVVGSANYDSELQRRLEHLSQSGAVHWLGHVSDQELLSQLWAHAGVYIHGHSVGGTNPALLQAMGFGAPTLALETAFNREVLGDEDFLYPHDATALAERVTAVLKDSDLQAQLARRAQARIREAYSWDEIIDRYEAALHEARAKRTAASAS